MEIVVGEDNRTDDQKLREAYQMVFANNPYGDVVFMDLLNDLGFFATDPDCIKPELTAAANRLLMKMGAYDTGRGLQRYIDGIIKTVRGDK